MRLRLSVLLFLLLGLVFSAQINQPPGVWTVVTSTSTGALNDFAPGLSSHSIIRMNNATLATISGIAGGVDGQHVIIQSVGAGQVDFVPQSGLSSAANRFINFATVGNTSEAAGVGVAEYVYDKTSLRWRLKLHEQGDWITPTYSGTDWTAATGAWNVDAGDVLANRYYLRGRTLSYQIAVATSSVTATPANLSKLLFGFTASGRNDGMITYSDNAATNVAGQSFAPDTATSIQFLRFNAGNFSTATDATVILSEGFVRVQ